MTDLVLRADEGGIATLTLNRADKRNALNLALWAELDAHISNLAAAGDAIGVVVLRANGPAAISGVATRSRPASVSMPPMMPACQ
jgi:enoyl-CoA hydratase/carnithine racemase